MNMTPCWDDQPCHFPLEVSRHRAGVFCHSFANVKTYLPSNLIHLTSQIFWIPSDPGQLELPEATGWLPLSRHGRCRAHCYRPWMDASCGCWGEAVTKCQGCVGCVGTIYWWGVCVCIWVSSNHDPFGDVINEVTLRFEFTQDELNKKPAMFLFIQVLSLTICGVQRAQVFVFACLYKWLYYLLW